MDSTYACNVVIDLEFTPVPRKRRVGGLWCEIIEVGAVKVTPGGEVVGEFSRMVKPTLAAGVSGGVHWLTGIGSEDLTAESTLGDVLADLAAWIGPERARMITWSDSDLAQVERECEAKGIEHGLPARWLDIQPLYARLMAMSRRRVSLGEAADWCGIENDRSSAHRALYDAQVTAEVFRMMAAGDCAAQREELRRRLGGGLGALTSSIGERCSGLAEMLANSASKSAA